jgi:hypothetical protein
MHEALNLCHLMLACPTISFKNDERKKLTRVAAQESARGHCFRIGRRLVGTHGGERGIAGSHGQLVPLI